MLHGEAVYSPAVKTVKNQLDLVLGNLLQLTLPQHGGWTGGSQDIPSNLSDSGIQL